MERHQSKTIGLPPVSQGSLSDRDWHKCGEIIALDAWSAGPMNSGPGRREDGGGAQTAGRESVDQGISRRSDPMADRLKAVRRRLWILNATLESLPAKIELACRQSGVWAGGDGLDRHQQSCDGLGDVHLAVKTEGVLGRWRAKWKIATLRSRADRAERRAAVAIDDASASFSAAIEAVLQAALARVNADGACRGCWFATAGQSGDEGRGGEPVQHTATSRRSSS
jgi:hypothetical protein